MAKENTSSSIFQDFSSLAAGLLPILQLFFDKLPDAFTKLFLATNYFTGISIVTLIISYIIIIAYQTRPFFTWTFPFQKGRLEKYNNYLMKLNAASVAKTWRTSN